MSGRWDLTPDQYDLAEAVEAVRAIPPRRIVVSGDVEVREWPPLPDCSTLDGCFCHAPVSKPTFVPRPPSRLERLRAAFGWHWR